MHIGKVHHVGWVVSDIEAAILSVKALFGSGCVVREVVEDSARQVLVCFVEGDYTIELIQPAGKGSPVYDLLRRAGATVYHVCIHVESIDAELERLSGLGALVVSGKSPAPAIQNRNVAFIYEKHLGLIELLE